MLLLKYDSSMGLEVDEYDLQLLANNSPLEEKISTRFKPSNQGHKHLCIYSSIDR